MVNKLRKNHRSPRRREIRRHAPAPQQNLRETLTSAKFAWASLYLLIFTLAGAFFALKGEKTLHLNDVLEDAIISRVAFSAIDEVKTERSRRDAFEREPRVYDPNLAYLTQLQDRFRELLTIAELDDYEKIDPSYRQRLELTPQAFELLRSFVQQGEPSERWRQMQRQFVSQIFSYSILDPDAHTRETSGSAINKISIRHPQPADHEPEEQARYTSEFVGIENLSKIERLITTAAGIFPSPLQPVIVQLMTQAPQPTYFVNTQLTELRRQQAAQRVQPHTEPFDAHAVLVAPGNAINRVHLERLDAEQKTFAASQTALQRSLHLLGTLGTVFLVAIGLWAYLFFYKHRVIENPMRGMGILVLLLAAQAMAVMFAQLDLRLIFLGATLPTLVVAMVLSIAYDQRFALAVAAIHALLVAISLDVSVPLLLVMLTGVAVATWQLHEVRTRSKLVETGLYTGLAMAVAAGLTSLAMRPLHLDGQLQRIGLDSLLALLSGLSTGILVQAFLPALEKIFKVTTSMTLKELNDASHPLLQRLAHEAPGTYQHSLRIADMAETAAEAIGANGLLCRVGAMYHDVGKINKPMYFIENQGGGPNRHNKLSPAMSLLIIVGHVKDGVEMAREYGLPTAIRHFIESHHGTTLVEFFYHAARRQTEQEQKPGPSEFEFRYPGPKPQTKEAGIMLLCDSLEAAARALPDPTPVRLEQLVHTIANKRLMDGQFDDCDLSLSELHRIEQAITKTLCAIYHARIKYPSSRDKQAETSPQAQRPAVASGDDPPPPTTAQAG